MWSNEPSEVYKLARHGFDGPQNHKRALEAAGFGSKGVIKDSPAARFQKEHFGGNIPKGGEFSRNQHLAMINNDDNKRYVGNDKDNVSINPASVLLTGASLFEVMNTLAALRIPKGDRGMTEKSDNDGSIWKTLGKVTGAIGAAAIGIGAYIYNNVTESDDEED